VRHTPLHQTAATVIVLALIVALLAAIGLLIGGQIGSQLGELWQRLPEFGRGVEQFISRR
jgi:predicted PurR-regulated permease PerM